MAMRPYVIDIGAIKNGFDVESKGDHSDSV